MPDQSNVIINYKGEAKKFSCLSCARSSGEISDGNIIKSEHFDLHQDYGTPIPGFLILSSKRHIQSIDEFTESEQIDFIKTLCRARKALRQTLGIKTTYLFQDEDTSYHFHIWIFPRYNWMNEKFGSRIQSIHPIIEYARKELRTQDNVAAVEKAVKKLKKYL